MRVEKIVRLVLGVMVTPEARGLDRHTKLKDLSAHESEERECGKEKKIPLRRSSVQSPTLGGRQE